MKMHYNAYPLIYKNTMKSIKYKSFIRIFITLLFCIITAPITFAQEFDYDDDDQDTDDVFDDTLYEDTSGSDDTFGDNDTSTTDYMFGNFSFGGRVGGTFSTITSDYKSISPRKFSFMGGLYAQYRLLNFFSIQAEVLYVREGSNFMNSSYFYYTGSRNTEYTSILNSHLTLHTLETPVLLRFNIPNHKIIEPNIILGPSFDFILNATSHDLIRLQQSNMILQNRTMENVSSSIEYYNISAVFGGGFAFKSGNLTYSVDLRYKIGMKNINNLATLNVNNTSRTNFSFNTIFLTAAVGF